eukprot:3713520-Heterocapsa_arctica.AAC.1
MKIKMNDLQGEEVDDNAQRGRGRSRVGGRRPREREGVQQEVSAPVGPGPRTPLAGVAGCRLPGSPPGVPLPASPGPAG